MRHAFDKDGYFEWLVRQIDGYSYEHSEMFAVLKYLNQIAFEETHPLDKNRILDCIEMRREYDDEASERSVKRRSVTVLEVLVRLSIDIETDITGVPGDEAPEIWFWQFVENLGLDEESTYEDCVSIVSSWLSGHISASGNGSPFVLHHRSGIDMRTKDVWNAAMMYVNEKIRYW